MTENDITDCYSIAQKVCRQCRIRSDTDIEDAKQEAVLSWLESGGNLRAVRKAVEQYINGEKRIRRKLGI